MSSLSTQNTGDIILADHHNQIYNLLKGVAGSGETITLVYNAAGVITLTPSSNPAASTELIIVNNAAGTRQFAITAGGDLVGTGGILTLPAGADTLVGRATTDTLTNKTLTAPTIADFTNAAHDHGDADDGGTLVTASLPTVPSCRVYNSAALAQASGTSDVALTFDSERFDTDTMHSTVTNTGRITFTTAGKYYVVLNIQWEANATGQRAIGIRLNGTTTIASFRTPANTADTLNFHVSTLYDFAATDYVEAVVWQNSTVELDIALAANFSPEFTAFRVGA